MLQIKQLTTFTCLAFILLTSCNNPSDTKQSTNTVDTSVTKTDIVKSKLDEAKETAKTIFEYVEQADTKKITKKQLDIKAKPLQRHLDSLRLLLTADEVKELDAYRTQLVSEMVDRKVIRDRK